MTSEAANLRGRNADDDDSEEHRIRPRAKADGFLSAKGTNYQYTIVTDAHHITGRKFPQDESPVTYEPGVFTKGKRSSDSLILLSNGLSAKPIAWVGKQVPLRGRRRWRRRRRKKSKRLFHKDPDAAAVFPLVNGGWLYVSNAENEEVGPYWNEGGVGVLRFNRGGRIVGYRKLVSGSSNNCGGGVTPWNSWISGEEVDGGQMLQVDPYGVKKWRYTAMGKLGKFESFAYDNEVSDAVVSSVSLPVYINCGLTILHRLRSQRSTRLEMEKQDSLLDLLRTKEDTNATCSLTTTIVGVHLSTGTLIT